MYLQPRKTKHLKKTKKGRLSKQEFKSNCLKFGNVGIKAIESGIITARQIEAARIAISRTTNRQAKVWIRVFPDLPITAKSKGSRMGKGKGSISFWSVRVRKGTMLFEGCSPKEKRDTFLQAMTLASSKFPVKTTLTFY